MTNDLPKPKGNKRYLIAAFCCLAYFVAFLDRSNIGVLLADVNFVEALGIGTDKSSQGSLMSAFLFWYGVSCFFIGPVVQRLGAHRALVIGLLLWSGLTAVMGMINLLSLFLVCRALLGLGESVLGPAVASLIQAWFPKQERARANGYWYVSMKIAQIVATPVLAWWIYQVGWRGSFFILAGIGLVPLVISMFGISDYPSLSKRITEEEKDYIIAGGGATVDQNKKIDFSFLKSPDFLCIVFLFGFLNMVAWGFMSWVPAFLKSTLGFSWKEMGALAGLPFLAATLSVIVVMPLMDKFNRRALFCQICCLVLTLALLSSMVTENRYLVVAILSLALGCSAPVFPAAYTMVQNITDKNQVASAIGVVNGVGYVFASFSPVGMGMLADMTGSLKAGFVGLGAASTIGIVLCIPLVRKRL